MIFSENKIFKHGKITNEPQKSEEESQSKQDKHKIEKSTLSIQKYNENYIQYGFIVLEKDNLVPFCMICLTTFK